MNEKTTDKLSLWNPPDGLIARLWAEQTIDIKEYRYFIVGKITHYFAVTIHALWIPIFLLLGIPTLVIFNLVSVALFTSNIILNKSRFFLTAVTLTLIEVIAHQALCVAYVGWDAGFQYYIISVCMLPFLTDEAHRIWKFALAGLCILSFLGLQLYFKDAIPLIPVNPGVLSAFNVTNVLFALLLIVFWSFYFNDSVNKAEAELAREQQKTEDLLHNILPSSIVARLKSERPTNESLTIADDFDDVTVLFLDIVDFTELSAQHSPEKLVELLNRVFSMFDDLAIAHHLEKIKTIGDAYMVAAGVPTSSSDDAARIAKFALDVTQHLETFNRLTGHNLKLRIGIASGPVVAGVIGKRKFAYDLWGDTVNVASRMESQGLIGEIQVAESTYLRLSETFNFAKREPILVKGKGRMQTYLLKAAQQISK
ncbi:MAG: adenylate/guanylate cyclase domain-containing protein [Cyanobacteria bacterium P01_F01_bin.150]